MKLARSHPLPSAKLRLAMGLRIVQAGKSKYYGAALGHFEKARAVLLKEGKAGEWRKVVGEIRRKHSRKSGFMPGFERLVEGGTTREPSFLAQARKRWDRASGRPSGGL